MNEYKVKFLFTSFCRFPGGEGAHAAFSVVKSLPFLPFIGLHVDLNMPDCDPWQLDRLEWDCDSGMFLVLGGDSDESPEEFEKYVAKLKADGWAVSVRRWDAHQA